MQYKSVIAAALLVGAVSADTGKLGDAAPINDNPVGVSYTATLHGGAVEGHVKAVSKNGKGVDFEVYIKSVTGSLSPAGYHIHDAPVSGDCGTTLAHLDPYQRGASPACDATKPETCEVGDLAGKHGKIDVVPYTKAYNDLYASLKPGIGAFFGNRSIVIHAGDEAKTRIACANFVLDDPETECDEEDEEEDDEECSDDEESLPHSSVTSTITVTKPCDACPGKTTVYTTTTVCDATDVPAKPTHGSGKPGHSGKPGSGSDKPLYPTGHSTGPHGPGSTGKPGSGSAKPTGSSGSGSGSNSTAPGVSKPVASGPSTYQPSTGAAATFGVSAVAALAAGLMAVMYAL